MKPAVPVRKLIVNADDFGLSAGVNRGILEAHRHGIVTAASLMTRGAGAHEAAAMARDAPTLDLGLHVDLGEWAYRDGTWTPTYQIVPLDDREAIANELQRQLDDFVTLTGMLPSHVDSHQHLHRHEPVASCLTSLGRQLAIPVREADPAIRYCGDFYGQDAKGNPFPTGIEPQTLDGILRRLGPGVTELACHPGYGSGLASTYAIERDRELACLRDPRLPEVIANLSIELCSFHDVAGKSVAHGS